MRPAAHPTVMTSDGSLTLLHPELNVTYHSCHGAVQESRHIFIGAGLEYLAVSNTEEALTILEVGYGTGLNALLTADWAITHARNIMYHAIEPHPIDLSLTDLKYQQYVSNIDAVDRVIRGTSEQFMCVRHECPLDAVSASIRADLVYYDAFSPKAQPEMWTEDALNKVKGLMRKQAVLVTFCAQGAFKRMLKKCNFTVHTLPGPPGKREMVRAILGNQMA